MTITAPEVSSTTTDDDDLNHYWCCDPNRAYCGSDLTDATEIEDFEINCVVCIEVDAASPLDQHAYTCVNHST